jgi:YHS domain-containing protein
MVLKLALLAGLLFITVKLFRKPKSVEEKRETELESAVETVQDPVDGTFVGKDTEFKVKYYDKVYYFGSKENMDKFIEDKKGEEK